MITEFNSGDTFTDGERRIEIEKIAHGYVYFWVQFNGERDRHSRNLRVHDFLDWLNKYGYERETDKAAV